MGKFTIEDESTIDNVTLTVDQCGIAVPALTLKNDDDELLFEFITQRKLKATIDALQRVLDEWNTGARP